MHLNLGKHCCHECGHEYTMKVMSHSKTDMPQPDDFVDLDDKTTAWAERYEEHRVILYCPKCHRENIVLL